MAATRSKAPVGSAQWILDERKQANQLVEEEVEEFGYSVRNEMEWLNEHMAEIFSSNQLNVTDIFKTPGKLRGKTPRTARKKNALEGRAPLTDIFAPNSQSKPSPAQQTPFYKQVVQFQVAEDPQQENREPAKQAFDATKKHTDSGYHGTTDDEVEAVLPGRSPQAVLVQPTIESVLEGNQRAKPRSSLQQLAPPQRRSTAESFVSANEDFVAKNTLKDKPLEDDEETIPDEEMVDMPEEEAKPDQLTDGEVASPVQDTSNQQSKIEAKSTDEALVELQMEIDAEDRVGDDAHDEMDIDGIQSPSEGSSPVKALLRKSSLTFSSLPAREPLAKKSMGARTSRTSHLDQFASSRRSQLGRFTGGKSLGGSQTATSHEDDDVIDEPEEAVRPRLSREESETTRIHNKTSTQRLHERINMLGQTKEPAHPKYPQLPVTVVGKVTEDKAPPPPPPKDVPTTLETHEGDDDEEDDWIAPIASSGAAGQHSRPQLLKSNTTDVMENVSGKTTVGELEHGVAPGQKPVAREESPVRPGFGHVKSISASALASPTRAALALEHGHKKTISVSNPPLGTSTTPAGSPAGRRYLDNPLSASKAKLYSVLKSAKGIFASSAGVSAQAKMEALSTPTLSPARRNQPANIEEIFSPNTAVDPAPALYPNLAASKSQTTLDMLSPKRTRSSSERDQRLKEKESQNQQRLEDDLEKARQAEREKAT
ncbi:hypothetical protein LTS18_008456, partial [Coniosporium uncinatum]